MEIQAQHISFLTYSKPEIFVATLVGLIGISLLVVSILSLPPCQINKWIFPLRAEIALPLLIGGSFFTSAFLIYVSFGVYQRFSLHQLEAKRKQNNTLNDSFSEESQEDNFIPPGGGSGPGLGELLPPGSNPIGQNSQGSMVSQEGGEDAFSPPQERCQFPLKLVMEAFGSHHDELLRRYPQGEKGSFEMLVNFYKRDADTKEEKEILEEFIQNLNVETPRQLVIAMKGFKENELEKTDEKAIYKAFLLQSIIEEYVRGSEDRLLIGWAASLFVILEKECREGLSKVVHAELRNILSTFRYDLFKSSLKDSFPPISAPHFEILLESPETQASAPTVYPAISQLPEEERRLLPDAVVALPEPPVSYFAALHPKDVGLLKEWETYLFTLYQSKHFSCEVLEPLCYQVLAHLPDPTTLVPFLDKLSEEERSQLADSLQNISILILTLHVILRRPSLPASRLCMLLKSLHFTLVTIHSISEIHFEGYTLPIDCFLFALQDPYLDLGSYGTAITKTLSAIEALGKEKTLLWEYRFSCSLDDTHARYTPIDLVKKHWQHGGSKTMESLYTFNCLLQGFTVPQFMLIPAGRNPTDRPMFQQKLRVIKSLVFETSDILLKERSLLSVKGLSILPNPYPMEFCSVNFSLFGKDTDPYLDLRKNTGDPITPYAESVKIAHGEIRKRLVEGVVSVTTKYNMDSDGNWIDKKRSHYNMSYDGPYTRSSVEKFPYPSIPPTEPILLEGLKQTNYAIDAEKFLFPYLSLETSLDLQKMASGRDNRASNALYTFRNHPELLTHHQYGRDFKQVFRLYLFRDQMILRELVQQPMHGGLLWKQIKELCEIYARNEDWESWLFLYRVETDLLGLLKESGFPEAQEALQRQHAEATEQLKSWIASAETDGKQRTHLAAFYLTFLYEKAILGFAKEAYVEMAAMYLAIRPRLDALELVDPLEAETLKNLGALLTTHFLQHSLSDEILDSLLSYKVNLPLKTRQWKSLGQGRYKTKNFYLDITCWGFFEEKGERKGLLPTSLRLHPVLKRLFSKKTLESEHCFHYATFPDGLHGGTAWQSEFMQDRRRYSLFICADGTLLLYRQNQASWEQWLPIQEGLEKLPSDAQHSFLWQIAPREGVLETAQGEKLYHLYFSAEQTIERIERYITPDRRVAAYCSSDPFLNALEQESGYLLFEENAKKTLLYVRHGVRYEWDENSGTWVCPNYPGYFLSCKPLEKWRAPLTHEGFTKPHLFSSQFRHYHLLENREGTALLLTPFTSYTKGVYRDHSDESTHNSIELNPTFDLPADMPSLVTLKLEKNGSFISSSPKDHLHLAYLFFIQGKYGEALLQLKNSQIAWSAQEEAAERKLIREWICSWPDKSANALAFKAQVLLGEHALASSICPNLEELLALDAALLPQLMDLLHPLLTKKAKIDPSLKLTEEQWRDVGFLKPRAIAWAKDNLSLQVLEEDVYQFYKTHPKATAEEILHFSLRREIDRLRNVLDSQPTIETPLELSHLPPYIPNALYDFSPWLELVAHEEKNNPLIRPEILGHELYQLFPKDDPSLANETGRRLADDLMVFLKETEQSRRLVKTDALEALQEALKTEITSLKRQEESQRQQILKLFQPPSLNSTSLTHRALKEQETHLDQLFEQARFCLGAGDFSCLVQTGALLEQDIGMLQDRLHRYLIVRTQRKLFERKKAAVRELAKDPDNSVTREETTRCLEEWSVYDVEKHPLAVQFLLFEDELNITIRLSQLKHIEVLALYLPYYLHEAMASGKTFLLRNIFCYLVQRINKKLLPGVITYAPLLQQHHKLFTQTNQRTLGRAAFCFQFSREKQPDTYAVYLMTLMHLKAVVRGDGYVDQTVNTILSLNNHLSHVISKLPPSDSQCVEPVLQKKYEYVKALQELQNLRTELVAVYSDELDKICQPDKEHNYAEGEKQLVDPCWYEPALVIVDLLQSPELADFLEVLQNNQLPKLSQEEFDKYLNQLAEALYTHYKLKFDKTLTLAYLTESAQNRLHAEVGKPSQQEVDAFYNKEILALPEEEKTHLQILHGFLGLVFRACKNKQAGVDFGKSKKDRITVRPYKGSDDCQETSQRNLLLTTILETCLDYVINKVEPEGAMSYVEAIRSQILQENKKEGETERGQQFIHHFQIAPSQVKEYNGIADILSQTPGLLSQYLREVIFKRATVEPEKIEGNSHHLGHLLKRTIGSSGSSERKDTLPRWIDRNNPYAYQKGVRGKLLFHLANDAALSPLAQDPEQQIRETLRPGDTYIDNMPVFPGLSGSMIANKLVPLDQTARFFDADDEVSTRIGGKVQKGEAGIQLASSISVITHKGRQGTDWKFAAGTHGILTIGALTTWTDFSQSLMRLRLLGKGQDPIIFYDSVLEKEWQKEKGLANKSLLTKLIWSLIQHEAEALKVLHYQANRKAISAISHKVIDKIKSQTKNHQIFDLIKGMLKKNTELRPEDVGRPLSLIASAQLLGDLKKGVERQLQLLRTQIEAFQETEDKKKSLLFIQEALAELEDPSLILDETLLPEKMPANPLDIDGFEEVEQTVNNDLELAQLTDVDVSLAGEDHLFLNDDLDQQRLQTEEHPFSFDGFEWYFVNIAALNFTLEPGRPAWWNPDAEPIERKERASHGLIDEVVFPGIYISNHGLGIYHGTGEWPDREMNMVSSVRGTELRRNRIWFYTDEEIKQKSLSPKVLAVILPDGRLHVHMGSIKDGDYAFFEPLYRQNHMQWKDISHEDLCMCFTTLEPELCEDQKKAVINAEEYKAKLNWYRANMFGHQFFKVDLRETELPPNLPDSYRAEWIKKMALAKFLYVDASFSQEELGVIQQWLQNECPVQQRPFLQKRLSAYLQRTRPSDPHHHPLLDFI